MVTNEPTDNAESTSEWPDPYGLRTLLDSLLDGGEHPEIDGADEQYERLLQEHPDISVADNGAVHFTHWAMLDVLADLDISPDDRPFLQSLASFSTPARLESQDRLNRMDPSEYEHEKRSVVIWATLCDLRAHVEAHIEWAIDRKIEQGELVRTDGGEIWSSNDTGQPHEPCEFCRVGAPESVALVDVRRHEQELRACLSCHEYLSGAVVAKPREPLESCLVCSAHVQNTGTRFVLCDDCWADIERGRRVLVEDGEMRTVPIELVERGEVWPRSEGAVNGSESGGADGKP